MAPQFSPMLPEDYPFVRALWEAADGVGLDESDEEERIAAYLLRNPGLSWVVRDTQRAENQQVVAAVLCGHDGRRGYLSHLAVAANYRNRGLARQLVDRCLSQLNAAGVLRCTIHVYANNEAGIAFWKRLGFSPRLELAVIQRTTDLS